MTQQTSTFKISYDIPEAANHTIDAELLGESIISTARLIKNTNKILNGEDAELNIEVKAPAPGSVVVEFVTLLNSAGINPLTTLGFVAGTVPGAATVLGAIQALQSRKVTLVEEEEEDEVQLKLSDNNAINLPVEVAKVALNRDVRKNLEKIINDPIHGAQSGQVIFKNENDENVVNIPVEQISFYKKPSKAVVEDVEEIEEDKEIRFVRVNFDGVTGWKIELPDRSEVAVKMSDETFIERVNQSQQKFSKEDLFSVSLKTVVTKKHGTKPTFKREITRVKRHRKNEEDKII